VQNFKRCDLYFVLYAKVQKKLNVQKLNCAKFDNAQKFNALCKPKIQNKLFFPEEEPGFPR